MPIGVDQLGSQPAPLQVSRSAQAPEAAPTAETGQPEERDRIGAQDGIRPPADAEVGRAETRAVGQALQAASEDIGAAQQAAAQLDAGEASLNRLGELAAQGREGEPEAEETDALNEEAQRLAARLREADNSDVVERIRRAIAEQQQRFDALRREDDTAAARIPTAPPLPDQPTLGLVPTGLAGEEDATGGGRPAGGAAAPARPESSAFAIPAGEPVASPASSDVSTPEAARDTEDAVSEALSRVSDLRRQVEAFGADAEARARGLVRQAGQRRGQGRALTQPAAEATAQRIARSTIENPAAAVNSQPFVSVEAALRVLA